jgi:hypothetical protein
MAIKQHATAVLVLIGLLFSIGQAAAQGPGQRSRFYDRQGRVYYRGPLRVTLGGGAALYSGDLTNRLSDKFLGPSVSAGLLYRLHPHLLIGAEGGYFRVGARDQYAERGLAFQGDNGLATVFLRYELLHDGSAYAIAQGEQPVIQPYVKAGVGLLMYSPQSYNGTTRPTGSTTYLAPERNDYAALAAVLPLGAGFSVRAGEQFRVSVEGAYYFTSTDHLDDISTRGNTAENDGFTTLELKVEYIIGR